MQFNSLFFTSFELFSSYPTSTPLSCFIFFTHLFLLRQSQKVENNITDHVYIQKLKLAFSPHVQDLDKIKWKIWMDIDPFLSSSFSVNISNYQLSGPFLSLPIFLFSNNTAQIQSLPIKIYRTSILRDLQSKHWIGLSCTDQIATRSMLDNQKFYKLMSHIPIEEKFSDNQTRSPL